MESMFIQFDGQTLILKRVDREAFLIKPKHQYRLSQWVECGYGAQSRKKGDYCMNPCLSQLTDEHYFKKYW